MMNLWRPIRPYLILALLGSALLWPLLGADVPCTDDGQLYYYQTATMRYGMENGLVYSRWLPDAALGYGIPLLNYREPLPRYLALIPVTFGVPTPLALNLVAAASILFAGWGAYRLTRDVFDDEAAGLVAGVATMAGPYLLMDVYRRGALPEIVALALVPWVLRAFWHTATADRLRPGSVIAAIFTWAALILSHNISALLLAPALLGYVILLGWLKLDSGQNERASHLQAGLRPTVVYLGGLSLAAFYWVPAFFERNLIQIWRATTTRNNNYVFNFVGIGEILSPPIRDNPSWLNPPMAIHLGLVTVILALFGIIVGWLPRHDRSRRAHIVGFGVLGVIYVTMALPISRSVWNFAPLLAFVQFPWRLAGFASLFAAILAGVGVGGLATRLQARPHLAFSVTGIIVAVLIAVGLPSACADGCPMASHPTITDVNRFECDALVGLDNEGSYFPVGATIPEESPMLVDYAAGIPPRRFDETALPNDATFEADYWPLSVIIHVTTPEPFRARYLSYDFPGWRVRLDGMHIPIVAEDDTGLITFDVPEGDHEIDVRFGITLFRAAMLAVSSLTLIGLGVMFWWGSRANCRRVEKDSRLKPTVSAVPASLDGRLWGAMATVGLIVIIARAVWPDDVGSPWQVSRPPTPQREMDVLFDGQVRLMGYDLESESRPVDREFRVDTYWERVGEMDRDTDVAWLVVDERGIIWSEKEGIAPRGAEQPPLPTFAWPLDAYATDSQLIRLLPGTPPGEYTLAVTLYDRDTLRPFVAPHGEGVTAQLPLQTVSVTWPEQPWPINALGIQYPLNALIGHLTLLGHNLDREEVWPGEVVLVTLFWESREEMTEASSVALTLDGEAIVGTAAARPSGVIPAGATWREQVFLRVPATAEAGERPIGVRIDGERLISLASITVRPLERVFESPPIAQPVDALFGESARLMGFEVSQEGEELAVTLVWGAENDMPVGYTVFVHALDGEGNIIAQSDAIPANGARPTTGWLPGEIVTDRHMVSIAPDRASALRIGLYDAATGVRLRLDDGTDAVVVSLR